MKNRILLRRGALATAVFIVCGFGGAVPVSAASLPDTAITSGPTQPTSTSSSATFTFESNDPNATFECSRDGLPYFACTSPRTETNFGNNYHNFFVRAQNSAGSDPTPARWGWTVSVPPSGVPDTTITSGPTQPTSTSSSATFTFESNDPNATFECSRDGLPYFACTSPRTETNFGNNYHNFFVRAQNSAGPDPTPAQWGWTVDTAGSEPPAGATLRFGAYPDVRPGDNKLQVLESFEKKVGRQLAVVREYLLWDSVFPDAYHSTLRTTPRQLIVSVRPRRTNGEQILWADIAGAAPGSRLHNEIVGWAGRIRDYGVPLYFTFHHEPEAVENLPHGTAPEFIAAWKRIVGIFREQGVTNAKFMWIMVDYSFWVSSSDRRAAFKWFPGDDWVDALAEDAYNWHTCREGINTPWTSLAEVIEPFRQFGQNHPSKELWLAEWGVVEDAAQSGRKAAWIDDAARMFKQPGYEQFRGLAYFHHGYSDGAFADCDWWVDTSESALAAFAAMGADPFYQAFPTVPPLPPPDPSVPPDTLITSGPERPISTASSATFTFESNDPAATFECSRDGQPYFACTSPRHETGFKDNLHNFFVRARNQAGVDPTPARWGWTVAAP